MQECEIFGVVHTLIATHNIIKIEREVALGRLVYRGMQTSTKPEGALVM